MRVRPVTSIRSAAGSPCTRTFANFLKRFRSIVDALGENAGGNLTTGSGNVCIGYNVFGTAGESNTTRIRNVYSSIASGRPVYVTSDNKIGTLALASWAVSQMQLAAKTAGADPSTIGFMPYPTQVNGHFCAVVSPDYQEAVSIHSAHKAAARAWVDWFVDHCTYAQDQGLLPTLKTGALPPELKAYQDAGVQFIELAQNQNARISTVDNASEIGLNKPDYRQHIVDLARGAAGGGGLDAYFADLDKKWSAALTSAGS